MVDMLVISLITSNVIIAIFMVLLFAIDKDGIINMLRLKLNKGSSLIMVLGKDKKLYMTTSKIAGKKTETTQVTVNGLPYTINKDRIIYYNTHPVLIYDEGISEPLKVDSGEMTYGKLTPELLSQMIVMARQSGRLPKTENMEKMQLILLIASAGASAFACAMIFQMFTEVGNLTTLGQNILGIVKTLAGAV